MMGLKFRYRVRGIYATAIAKLLLDSGAELVDLSKQLADRFGLPMRSDEPPHATVKAGDEDPHTLVIVGYRDAVENCFEVLESSIPFTVSRFVELGPYTTVTAKIVERSASECIAELPGGERARIPECNEDVGKVIAVHVVRAPSKLGELYVARKGIAVVTDSVTLVDDGRARISFSEHVRNFERRAELTMLSQEAVRMGLSVKWRSAARSLSLDKMMEDLRRGIELVEQLRAKALNASDPQVLSFGESIAFISLSRSSKEFLDHIRRLVVPTTPLHHTLKSCSFPQPVVDALDVMSVELPLNALEKGISRYIIETLKNFASIRLKHVKPDGEEIHIGPAYVQSATYSDLLGPILVLKRVVKSEGIYDALNVAKEVGDEITTIVPLEKWFLIHVYRSPQGVLKGVYVNINTPPELDLGRNEVRYIDLYVDVVSTSNEPRVVDMEQLEEMHVRGVVAGDLLYMAKQTVAEVLARFESLKNEALQFV